MEAPRLGTVDLQDLSEGDAEALASRESHDALTFADADLSDYDLEGSGFSECLLTGLTLTETKLRGSRFVETVLVDPFASALRAQRTTWRDVRIERPRWGSAELFDSELDSVRVEGGKIDYLNLRSSELTDVVFEGAVIGELDLGGVTARRVAFVDCRIGTIDVTRASLDSVDLRGTGFESVTGLSGLRGAVVDTEQLWLLAPLLAAEIGIVVV
ncbi:pentapeptide repeat-containing protein [Frondihabitans cladoniiphilus]|uniref:Pentapeptide repeat-containing protein n=1 Tax=Frondihabitans cladoniiphilus TaxID=715785 RepID=A0ABP8W168_9MICO